MWGRIYRIHEICRSIRVIQNVILPELSEVREIEMSPPESLWAHDKTARYRL